MNDDREQELIDAAFPGVPIEDDLGPHETMLCTAKAERLLGWKADYTWRKVLGLNESSSPR